MRYEQEAKTFQSMEEKIRELENMLNDMNIDFEKCARGISPCFFCANDQHCVNPEEHGCHFIWKRHE